MAYDDPGIAGWIDGAELQWLFERAQEMKSIIEIGSWKGKSTHALLSGCPGPVFAVDHFKGSPDELQGAHHEATHSDIHAQFIANVGKFKNLVCLRMDSIEAARFFREKSVDMIFIDGCHTLEAVLADLRAWLPVCRRLMCGHDISLGTVKEALGIMGLNFKEEVSSIWSVVL
jgi:hypothetical protein